MAPFILNAFSTVDLDIKWVEEYVHSWLIDNISSEVTVTAESGETIQLSVASKEISVEISMTIEGEQHMMASTQSVKHTWKASGSQTISLTIDREMSLLMMANYDAAPKCEQEINDNLIVNKTNADSF